MTDEEWRELLEEHIDPARYEELMTKTEEEYNHPWWYNGPCYCVSCYPRIEE